MLMLKKTSFCFSHLWILCLCQSCVPPSPSYQPQEPDDIVYPSVPQFQDGIQAILPDYQFNCSGLVKEIIVNAISESEFVLQIWRPVGNGLFTKLWGETYPSIVTFVRISFDSLRWKASIGIPVMPGDVFGFYIEKTESPLQLLYSNSSSGPSSTLFYVRNVDSSLCNMSLCDDSIHRQINTAPFIRTSQFESADEAQISFAEIFLSQTQLITLCSTSSFSSCPIQTTRINRDMLQTSPIVETTSSSPLSSSIITLTPTPLSNTDSSTVTPSSTGISIENGTADEVQPSDGATPTSPGVVVKLSPEAIAFIVIGILLLVVLVVLVFVLIACLRSKGAKVEQSSCVESKSTRTADVDSVDSRITMSTHLAGSTSVEHSISSNEVGSTRNRSTSHHYINGEITHNGVFSSFSPQYVNTHNSPLVQSTSHDHLRGERVWSTSALKSSRVYLPSTSSAQSRARSVEPSARLCTGFNAIQAPSVPPRRHVRSHGVTSKQPERFSALEMSGDYDDPIPPQDRNRVQSCVGWIGSRVDRFPHDYADPDKPSEIQYEVAQSKKYDRLIPKDESPQFEQEFADSDSIVPGPQINRSEDGIDDHSYSDPDGLSVGNSLGRSSNYNYSYVPTEDQRTVMMMNGGHYEMQAGFQQETLTYDHLKFFEERETYWAPATTESGLYTQLYENKYRELPRNQIRLIKRIGSGHFGTVSMGVWINGVDTDPVQVAIKTVKATTDLERIKLLQEAAIMGQFAHSNVVRLLGVVTVEDPVLMILEYMTKGDLRSFLQKLHPKVSRRELPEVLPKLFIKFSKEIANGMSYLSKKNFVHRDLAARNILLTNDLTCKIGDFGMARDIENDYYKSHGGIIPVKWTAPEALNYNKFSTASDVWSFGMVLFEIWSLGEKPFNELTNPIVIALVSSKHCQPPPPGCPRAIYHLMVECWNPDPSKRPTFDSVYTYLDSPVENLTYWHSSDKIPERRAHVLGAPLRESNNLYLELQRTYQKPLIANSSQE